MDEVIEFLNKKGFVDENTCICIINGYHFLIETLKKSDEFNNTYHFNVVDRYITVNIAKNSSIYIANTDYLISITGDGYYYSSKNFIKETGKVTVFIRDKDKEIKVTEI